MPGGTEGSRAPRPAVTARGPGGAEGKRVNMDSPTERAPRDTMPDTWVAWDGQGRRVGTGGDQGIPGPRQRKVGIFYWAWHGNVEDNRNRRGPYDVSKILDSYPDALADPDNPAWGRPNGTTHHWGEPALGYYLDDDEYVLRKHAQMLCDAGVDFIALDISNFGTSKVNGEHPGYFRKSTQCMLDTHLKIRAEGKPTPEVTFICPFFTPDWTCVKAVYEDFYSQDAYLPLWYRLDGKPLMLYNGEAVADPHLRGFFTFRRNMPDYHLGPTGPDQWPWLEVHPQHPFYASADPHHPEIVSVGVAQNSVIHPEGGWRLGALSERDEHGRYIARGRSFHNGRQPQPEEPLHQSEKGYNFQEQWERALAFDPSCVFITGWNEWIMGRWDTFIHYTGPSGVFVDQFNWEFSRDIEPMRGGHRDDYYYQLVHNIRRFKGARTLGHATEARAMDVRDLSVWNGVAHAYLDDEGDTLGRHHPGYGQVGEYAVPHGQNDFSVCKVAHDAADVYFYVRTVEPISPYLCGLGSWMQLLIRINNRDLKSWEGFHFTVNRILKTQDRGVLECSRGGWDWTALCEVPLQVAGNEMAIGIPRHALCLADGPIDISFKWIDSMSPEQDILELYTHGDTAPNGRFAYLYREAPGAAGASGGS